MSILINALMLKASLVLAHPSERGQPVIWGEMQASIADILLNDSPCSSRLMELGVCLPEDASARDAFACTGDPLGFIEALESSNGSPRLVRVEATQALLAQLHDATGAQAASDGVEARLRRAVERDQAIRRWRPDPWSRVANAVKWTVACTHAAYGAALVEEAIDSIPVDRLEEDQQLAENIWLLSQHVDHDPDFQERMAGFFRRGDSAHMRAHAAFLTDRHRQWRGLPQIYGTQFRCIDGVLQPFNLMEPETVDERRAANGLGPITEAVSGEAFTSCG